MVAPEANLDVGTEPAPGDLARRGQGKGARVFMRHAEGVDQERGMDGYFSHSCAASFLSKFLLFGRLVASQIATSDGGRFHLRRPRHVQIRIQASCPPRCLAWLPASRACRHIRDTLLFRVALFQESPAAQHIPDANHRLRSPVNR